MHNESELIIGRRSTGYRILKNLARAAFYIFYRKIRVYGRENIPDDGGLIFAANHRNALMDALAVLLTNRYQPVYLARADIFKNRLAAMILRFLKIMPVYRFRDGVGTMGQNEDTFRNTTAVLAQGGCIGIMPEGNHGEQKRLRTLKKGIFRIAFRAIEESGKNVSIVPAGLDFTDTDRFREELVVNYGRPLAVSDYYDLYRVHPQRGINAMRKDLAGRMSELIIDIKDEANYRADRLLIETGSDEAGKRRVMNGADGTCRFILQRAFCKSMYEYFEREPEAAGRLRDKGEKLLELLDRHGIPSPGGHCPGRSGAYSAKILRVLCFPVFLAGALIHMLPLVLIRLALMQLKDLQFISSYKFVLGFLLVPLNYVIAGLVLYFLIPPEYLFPAIVAMPVLGILAHMCYRYSEEAGRIIGQYRASKNHPADFEEMSRLREDLRVKLDPVVKCCLEKLLT